jgi:hypothetical protein
MAASCGSCQPPAGLIITGTSSSNCHVKHRFIIVVATSSFQAPLSIQLSLIDCNSLELGPPDRLAGWHDASCNNCQLQTSLAKQTVLQGHLTVR